MSSAPRKVFYVYPPLFKYRAPFNEALRAKLAPQGIDYRVVYCDPPPLSKQKSDTTDLPWAIKTPIHYLGPQWPQHGGVAYQDALAAVKDADLIILQQENRLLFNYVAQLRRPFSKSKVAFFGHGRNFQAPEDKGMALRVKKFLATRVDWWFAYNDLSARVVESYGFPASRITSFRNSIDMKTLQDEIASISPADLAARRVSLGLKSRHVGIYVGGIYGWKRMDFLMKAAERIRAAVPDFELLVIGGGPDAHFVEAAAKQNAYIRFLGARYGREKTELAMLADVFLMPGLVGLAVLDSFGYGTPMVTTDYPYHSPEIDYLKDGINGRIARPWEDVQAYADAVVELFRKPELLQRLAANARAEAPQYTIEAMAERFAGGVVKALETA